jgi:DNA-binding beta-propeller fold protein YncE
LGTHPPFQGKELTQLQATSTFLTSLLMVAVSGWGLFYLTRSWSVAQIGRLVTLTFLALLALLTLRTAIRAAYINYDNATEFLVYAHSARGPKDALEQIEEISRRTTDGLGLVVAYDNDTSYPFWWYLRNYPNQRYYGENPTRDLRQAAVILVGQENYGKIEPVVGQGYYRFEYIRLWWPNQDYFNLNWERIWNAIRSPQWREALFQIWFNRDYSEYGVLTNRDMSLQKWQPSTSMRMYIQKDIVSQLWNYGMTPAPEEVVTDPYEGKEIKLNADIVLGSLGSEPGQFQRPRDLAVAPDGSLYVADTGNHRIQHLGRDGSVLHVWGTYASILEGEAPPGTFNEPWGITIAPDGTVYVMDTWNFRIQKFTPDGKFLQMWGYDSPTVVPFALYGPRDGVIDSQGRLLVSDTGNRRIVLYDANGNYLGEFGKAGFAPGQFDEPVGLAIDSQDHLYVADTWNQRIQVFAPDETGSYLPLNSWEVYAWFGQSIDNKPYLAVDDDGHLFATDPEGYRVLEFTTQGEIIRFWGDYSLGNDGFGMAGAVAVDPLGGVWVSDTGNSRLMHFTLP